MAGLIGHLKVSQRSAVNGRWGRRRAGFAFGQEPTELSREDVGEGLAGLATLVTLASDPLLSVVLVTDEAGEQPIGEAEVAELQAVLEAERLRVDPANPPPVEGLAETIFQAASGAEGASDDAAASSDAPEAKVSEVKDADAADPARTSGAPAASGEESREQAGDAAADQKAASTEEKQPEETARPSVAGTTTGKKSRPAKASSPKPQQG